ncbi:MAG: hypothetical protein ACXWKP_33685 [Bradyrhizobium sp.]
MTSYESSAEYLGNTIETTDGKQYSQYQTPRAIELYHNSRYLTGNKDTLGREKMPIYLLESKLISLP